MSVRVIDARPSFGRNCFACTAASSWSWCPRSAGALAVVAIVWRSKTSSSSRAGHYVQWKMTHSSHQTNGASLEDCHTNFFALVSSSYPLHTVLRGGPPAYTSIRSEFVLRPTTLNVFQSLKSLRLVRSISAVFARCWRSVRYVCSLYLRRPNRRFGQLIICLLWVWHH